MNGAAPYSPLPDDTPLAEARAWTRDRVRDGVRCPCCTQLARVYRRKLNSGMALALAVFYRRCGQEWGHKPTVLRGVGAAARDESLLRYWGLFEEEAARRDDGGRAGWWRVTSRGARFVRDALEVPRYAVVYDGRCLNLAGEPVGIRDVLGDRFDLAELLAA